MVGTAIMMKELYTFGCLTGLATSHRLDVINRSIVILWRTLDGFPESDL